MKELLGLFELKDTHWKWFMLHVAGIERSKVRQHTVEISEED
jgi:hypothetical protein